MGEKIDKLVKAFTAAYMEVRIEPNHEYLQYMGRIDFSKEGGPEFVFPCTYVKIKFKGRDFVSVTLTNTKNCWEI